MFVNSCLGCLAGTSQLHSTNSQKVGQVQQPWAIQAVIILPACAELQLEHIAARCFARPS